MTKVDNSSNCFTAGVHHGRNDPAYFTSLSEINLSDAAIYRMAEEKIEADAKSYVEQGVMSWAWADRVFELWAERFDAVVKNARENAERYQQDVKLWNDHPQFGTKYKGRQQEKRKTTTNSSWNDHVNYICRVLGTNANLTAQKELGDAAWQNRGES